MVMRLEGSREEFYQFIAWIAVWSIVVLTISAVRRYFVDVPFQDEWEFVPQLEAFTSIKKALVVFWSQHAEHRFFFPKLVLFPLALATSWNHWAERVLNFMLAGAVLMVLIAAVRRLRDLLSPLSVCASTVFIAASVFSLRQLESWSLGIQLNAFMADLAVVAGLLTVFYPPFEWKKFWFGIMTGILALYSNGTGLSYWIVFLFGLCWTPFKEKSQKKNALVAGGLIFAALMGSYLYHYYTPEKYSPSYGLKHPEQWAAYLLIYLGSPLSNDGYHAFFLGYFGLVWLGLIGIRILRLDLRTAMGFWWIIMYAVVNALITATSRVGLGVGQAMASRYVTNSHLFWVGMFILTLVVHSKSQGKADQSSRSRWFNFLCILVPMTIFCFTVHVSFKSIEGFAKGSDRIARAKPELYILKSDKKLKFFYPHPDVLRQRVEILRRHHWSIFRDV